MPEKLTFDELKNHLWAAADILRGSLDANEFRQPIMTLLFLKRLSDQFEEKAEFLEKEGKNHKTAWNDPDYHSFFVPPKARWNKIAETFENVGEKIDNVCSLIEQVNSSILEGVLTNTSYNDKKRFPDDVLLELVGHFNKKPLGNSNLENEDIFGQAYEYLLEQFADSAGKKAGEFFTPREVVSLLIQLLEPKEDTMICDPTCGSGGMLIWSRKYVEEHHGNPKNLSLHGQERNYGNFGMCKMNMILHGVENFKIEHGNVLSEPLLTDDRGLLKYDIVVANFPFSMNWTNSSASQDKFHRFDLGTSPKNFADFAFIQHMFSSLNNSGKAAIISSQGVLFRGAQEEEIRKSLIEMDVVEAIISLPKNLFYGTGIPACVFFINKKKPKSRKNKIALIYAAKDFLDAGKRDLLNKENILKIISAFKNFEEIKNYCHIADLDEIKDNNYNLNVARYIDISKKEKLVDVKQVYSKLNELQNQRSTSEKKVNKDLKDLGFEIK